MMAERRRKQTWSLNPRGKDWSENSNKFGQKLMEKMGWSAGKGLGANEDGMTDHIRVAYKNDTQGMGFKETDDQWTEHQSNFSKLLNTLSGSKKDEEGGNEPKIESLEKKSQISKARVHYRKFTRGKDLSRYSEKDLANIFGKKSLKDLTKSEERNVEKEDEKENSETKSFGVVTHNGGNMLDYFKNKWPKFKNNSTINSHKDLNHDSESDVERPSFSLGNGVNGTQNEEKPNYQSEFIDRKPKKKNGDETDNFRRTCFGLGYDRYNGNESKPKSKFTSFVKATDTAEKKKPLEYGISKCFSEKDKNIENTNENPSDNETPTNGFGFNKSNINKIQSSFMSFIKGSDQTNNPIENGKNDNKVEKKKRKKKSSDNDIDENEGDSTMNSEDRKKKKTKKIKMIESEISSADGEVSTSGLGFKIKKKENNLKPTFKSFIEENGTVDDEDSTNMKKKNKKDKSKKVTNSDEPVENNTIEEECVGNENPENITKKKKKSKKDKSKKEENLDAVLDNSNIEESVPPKKGKKRKSESELDVAFTPMKKKFKNFEDLHNLQDEAKIVETHSKKSKKKKGDKNVESCNDINQHQNGLANPAFDPLYNAVAVQKHNLDAIVEEPENITESPIEKVTKKDTNIEITTDQNKSERKKKKKSRSIEGIDNPYVEELSKMDESCQTMDDSLVSETQKKKKSKKSKKEKDIPSVGIENSAFDENVKENESVQENNGKYEIKGKKRKRQENEASIEDTPNGKKKKKKKHVVANEVALENNSSSQETSQAEETVDGTPSKSKKKKKKHLLAVENPCFNSDDSFISLDVTPNKYEVKRSKKDDKNLGIVNPGLDLTSPPPIGDDKNGTMTEELPVMDENLMLNVVNTPIIKKDNVKKPQRRKSVRFSDVNQSIFMNKLDSPADLRKNGGAGLDNAAYDQLGNRIEENIDTLNKQLDDYQAEVENDLNEAKMQIMIGEVGDPNGENEALPSGEVKLKFKYANFGRLPPWMTKSKALTNPKSSYRHLIKGDIVLGFKNTNMHAIKGYNEHLKECSP